jgi:hypothetical protein
LLLCALLPVVACGGAALRVRSVPLAGAGARSGEVVAVALLELRSAHGRFGGLSGIELAADGGALWAVSDRGHWLRAELQRDARGALTGLGAWQAGPLLDLGGRPVRDAWVDAESLVRAPDGALLVSFEQHHRLWRYAPTLAATPREVPVPAGLRAAPANGGLEAIAALADGRLVLLCEDHAGPDGALRAWIGRPGRYEAFSVVPTEGFVPTDLAPLPGGDLLVLERRFTVLTGVSIRIRRIPAAELRAGARLVPREIFRVRPPLAVDNFEGLAAEQRRGVTYLYLVSDDNFSALQRTLLYQLRLVR